MSKRNVWTAAGCAVLALAACSSHKDIPQGTRISVLDQTSAVKADVADGSALIKIPAAKENSSWLQEGYNAQHAVPSVKAGTEFKKQWSADFGKGRSKREILLSAPLIYKNTVYTLDADGVAGAYNLKDGENIWRMELVSENSNAEDSALKGAGLAIADDTIYVTLGFGSVAAIKAKDGSKVWEKSLKVPLRIAPVVADGKVFVQSADNRFYALDAKNGEILWSYDTALENTTVIGGAAPAYSSALDVIIGGFSGGDVQAFNAEFGTPLWSDNAVSVRQAYSSTFLHAVKASPVVEGETVYILGSADVLAAVDIRSGSRIWEKETGGTKTPLLAGNTLFVVTNDNDLIAVNKADGKVLWATPVELGGKASEVEPFEPRLINNRLVLALSNGRVNTYDPKTGTKINTVDLDEDLNSAPVAAGGYIIFTTANAKLLAYK